MRRRRRGIGDKTGTFVSTWQTDNAGTSGATQITLPLEASGDYDFGINWGDGSSSKITAYDQAEVTHTYPIAGTYTVKIDGVINGFRFNNGGDKAKITDISQWGDLLLGNSNGYFHGCSNLDVSATDAWDVSSVTTFDYAFSGCSSLTTLDVSNWDVSSGTTFFSTFYLCSELTILDVSSWELNIDEDITLRSTFQSCSKLTTLDVSSWDTSRVTDFYRFVQGCSALKTLDVSNWDTSKVTNFFVSFGACTDLVGLDISNFNISSLTDAEYMLNGTTISNYSEVLINWAAQIPNIQNEVVFGAGSNTYNAAGADAKALLEAAPYLWDIGDGGAE